MIRSTNSTIRATNGPEEGEPPSEPTPEAGIPRRARDALYDHRTVLLFGEISTPLASRVSSELLALAAASDAPIRLVIHSPGGHVESGDTIHDVIRFIAPDVHVIGTGWVASAAALIYCAARKEHRFALPHTRFLLHQPMGGVRGPASDIEIEAAQIAAMKTRLNQIFADATGRDVDTIARETERNFWMSAEEARAYGLVHRVIGSMRELDAPG